VRRTTDQSKYASIYGGYLQLQRAVIDGGYKLIVYPEAKVVRLYHVAKDPHEMRDLAGDPQHAGTTRRLFDRLIELQRELGDALELGSLAEVGGPRATS
jgi:choline-sulfatase